MQRAAKGEARCTEASSRLRLGGGAWPVRRLSSRAFTRRWFTSFEICTNK